MYLCWIYSLYFSWHLDFSTKSLLYVQGFSVILGKLQFLNCWVAYVNKSDQNGSLGTKNCECDNFYFPNRTKTLLDFNLIINNCSFDAHSMLIHSIILQSTPKKTTKMNSEKSNFSNSIETNNKYINLKNRKKCLTKD